MKRSQALLTLLAFIATPVLADATPPAVPQAAAAMDAPAEPQKFVYLDAADYNPDLLVPAPPARGSQLEALELARLHMLIGSATKERLAQARWDGDHEDPSIFNEAAGRDLGRLPKTWALLTAVQNETDVAVGMGKQHFARIRPWGIDASVNMCGANTGKNPARSYPSGHAGLGWSVGFVLAQLLPAKAPAILARADDYAISREICGNHFRSDTEASHAIGTLIASRLLSDPRLAAQVAAARAELSQP